MSEVTGTDAPDDTDVLLALRERAESILMRLSREIEKAEAAKRDIEKEIADLDRQIDKKQKNA